MKIKGLTFSVSIEPDYDMRAPWIEHDGHGPVRKTHDVACKRPGERLLKTTRQGGAYLYDVQQAMRIAKADNWGIRGDASGMTRGQVKAAAVEADYQRLRAWLNDDWHWCGVIVTLLDVDGDETSVSASMWCIESDSGECLEEVARELADELVHNIGRRKHVIKGAKRWRVRP